MFPVGSVERKNDMRGWKQMEQNNGGVSQQFNN